MENAPNLQPCGDEIERALMDLAPLLGVNVNVKEEVPDDLLHDDTAPAPPMLQSNDGVQSDAVVASKTEEAGGADSLASPGAARASWAALRCVYCNAPLTHAEGTPKLMECLHSACEPCIKAKVEEKQASGRDFLGAERMWIQCGACRLQCQPCNMIEQRFVLEKMTAEQAGSSGAGGPSQQCSSCEDTEPATSYCMDCADFICDSCVTAHQRLKITKDHTIKSREEALGLGGGGAGVGGLQCKEHPQERLALFCETCDRLTCRDCQLTHHRDHKYQFSTEMAAQARQSISSLLSEVSYKRVLLGSAMKVIRDRQALIADKKKALVHDITQTVVKLTNAINTRGKELVLRLNEVCDAKQKILSEKKEALEQLSAITDHCIEFVNSALEQGSDTAVLYSKRAVSQHLQRIKSRRADIPNPEIPVRISLALDKLPELIKVLSSIGGIVVDGKMDGGGVPSQQGPYHPPPGAPAPATVPAPAPPAPTVSAHSAVVALQQVAMQQSYVQSRSVVGSGAGSPGAPPPYGSAIMSALSQQMSRAHRLATPLRHPHVTSTTYPHHLTGMNEMNLRGLLTPGLARAQYQPRAHQPQPHHQVQAMQHAYQQVMGAYAAGAYGTGGRRGPRAPSPAPAPYPYPTLPPAPAAVSAPAPTAAAHAAPPAKWHIPQHASNGGSEMCSSGGTLDFKITLGRQHRAPPSAVTSTNPKTPSPCLSADAVSLDRLCADSVQDLMATIAKLDSNGVQVLPEHAPPPSPHVHSSTDDPHHHKAGAGTGAGAVAAGTGAVATGTGAVASGDPNEDWCAVCMDGGELMCCDKCPKVFHQYCHIPTIDKLPEETETWQCLLCVNFAELPPDTERVSGALTTRQQKLIERITLELYCQYESSLPFREPVPAENEQYYRTIARPVCLDAVRARLQPSAKQRYSHLTHYVSDIRLMFQNAYDYNAVDSQIYKDAKRLEEFFDSQLAKWLPEYVYWRAPPEAGSPSPAAALSPSHPTIKRARLSAD